MADMESELLAAVPYTGGRELRITRSIFKGYELIDLRLWRNEALPLDGQDEWHPTRKGISIRLDKFSEVMRALREAEESLDG